MSLLDWRFTDLTEVVSKFKPEQVYAFDFETFGNNPIDPQFSIASVAFSSGKGAIAIDFREGGQEFMVCLFEELQRKGIRLIAHNLYYDWMCLSRYLLTWETYPMLLDTFALAKLLANEGWVGQSWGLKTLQQDLLGWDERGDIELDVHLMEKGITKGAGSKRRADHSRIALADQAVLLKYNALDAWSTYHLWEKVLQPVADKFSEGELGVNAYIRTILNANIRLLIKNFWSGIRIDTEKLLSVEAATHERMLEARKVFCNHPDVTPYVAERLERALQDFPEPQERFKKKRIKKEPKKFNKDGSISHVWTRWLNVREAPEEETVRYGMWRAKTEALKTTADNYETIKGTKLFNIGSSDHLRELFYERLKFPVLLTTKAGCPAVDKNACIGFGEVGKLLRDYAKEAKMLTFISSLKQRMVNGVLHPRFKVAGALTTRLGGDGGFNIQNPIKDINFLECFIPSDGWVFVDSDFSSQENVMMALASQDKNLLFLYGPEAKQNCGYLFFGAFTPLGEHFRKHGYDPYNPTKEAIDACKKHEKKRRGIAKIASLAISYSCGQAKLFQTFSINKVEITREESDAIHCSFWETFSGLKAFNDHLQEQINRTKGWVISPVGLPVCFCDDSKRRAVNKVIQLSSHVLTQMSIYLLEKVMRDRGIPWMPVVIDWHDEFMISVQEKHLPEWTSIVKEIEDKLQEMIQSPVRFRLSPDYGYTFAALKIEGAGKGGSSVV